jgi:hypothetical protein
MGGDGCRGGGRQGGVYHGEASSGEVGGGVWSLRRGMSEEGGVVNAKSRPTGDGSAWEDRWALFASRPTCAAPPAALSTSGGGLVCESSYFTILG